MTVPCHYGGHRALSTARSLKHTRVSAGLGLVHTTSIGAHSFAAWEKPAPARKARAPEGPSIFRSQKGTQCSFPSSTTLVFLALRQLLYSRNCRVFAPSSPSKTSTPHASCGHYACAPKTPPTSFSSSVTDSNRGTTSRGVVGIQRQLSRRVAQVSSGPADSMVVIAGEDVGSVGGSIETAVMKALEDKLGSPIDYGPMVPPQKPLMIIISGPSGVGKDAVIKRLQKRRPELHMVVTATSRKARAGEVHGKDYFFISKEEFQQMIDGGELLEHALVYGDFKGIPKQQVRETMARGTDVVLRIDVQGAATVRSMLGDGGVFIFLVAESEAALVRRLVERKTESLDKVLLRLETAREESKRMAEFDYVVVNADGQLDRTVDMIASIIDAEKARVRPREPKL